MNAPTITSTFKPSPWLDQHPTLGIALIDHLFNRFDGAYPNRWRSAFANADAIRNWRDAWAEAFDEEGVTPQMVADGLRACRRMFDWPPSLTEFLRACTEPASIDEMLDEAICQLRQREFGRDEWSNPRIYWAAQKVGVYDMRNLSRKELKERFSAAYRSDSISSEPVPKPMIALPDVGKTHTDNEAAQENLQNLKLIIAKATTVISK
jgi:hypothetical protein